jgi:hypothetical protein
MHGIPSCGSQKATRASDSSRMALPDWDIYNTREKGGIAKPAEFCAQRHFLRREGQFSTMVNRAGGAAPVADGDTSKMNFVPSKLASHLKYSGGCGTSPFGLNKGLGIPD